MNADQLDRHCSDVLARAIPDFCANLQRHLDDNFEALAARLQAPILNLNVRSPKRFQQQQFGARPQVAIAIVGAGSPLPVAKFLHEKQRADPSWASIRKSYAQNFTNVVMALHKKKLADAGLSPQYVLQNHRLQIFYGESHRQTMEEAWDLTAAHRLELVASQSGGPPRRPVSAGPSVIDLLRA